MLNGQCARLISEKVHYVPNTLLFSRICTSTHSGFSLYIVLMLLPLVKGYVTITELVNELQKIGVSNEELRAEDVQMIVNTLIYDGKVEEMRQEGSKGQEVYLYKPSKIAPPEFNGLTEVPCGQCPVRVT